MSGIVEKIYNGDRAEKVKDTINQNFSNIAKYLPSNFISLTTIERENLSDEYKTHFKFVFDKEQEYVYKWSEIERSWKKYLIKAKDEYARTEVDTNTEMAFSNIEIGKDTDGNQNPYYITFYNRKGTPKKSVFLTAENIKYNEENSIDNIIKNNISNFNSLNDFVGNRDIFLNNINIASKTITEALNEINQKTIDNQTEITKIKNGTTVVLKSEHSNESSHSLNSDLSTDSTKLGGQLPSFYAKQSEADKTNSSLNDTITRVEKNESDIANLQVSETTTINNLNSLTNRIDGHDTQITNMLNDQTTHTGQIGELYEEYNDLVTQIGWQILSE